MIQGQPKSRETAEPEQQGPFEILYGRIKLPKHGIFESSLYLSIFIIYIIGNGCYQAYTFTEEYKDELIASNSVQKGWIFDRYVDGDVSYSFWKAFHVLFLKWTICYVVLSLTLRFIPNGHQYKFAASGFFGIAVSLNAMGALFFIHVLECLTIYLVGRFTRKKWIVWLISCLIIINYQGYLFTITFELCDIMKFAQRYVDNEPWSSEQREMAIVSFASLTTLGYHRIISFTLSLCDNKKNDEKYSFIHLIFYTCYYPFAVHEPIINYDLFYKQMTQNYKSFTMDQLHDIFCSCLRFIFYFLVAEFSLHYMWLFGISRQEYILRSMPLLALGSYSLLIAAYFSLLYNTFWEFSGILAKIDGIYSHRTPKCVISIYRYSEMWRKFDRGLYSFLKSAIYIPLGGSRNGKYMQLFATCMCFLYVAEWHGGTRLYTIWAIINFFNIVGEKLVDHFIYRIRHKFTKSWLRRIYAIFYAILILPSIWSNIAFTSSVEIGDVTYERIICGGFTPIMATLFILYLVVQNGIDVMEFESKLTAKHDKLWSL